MDQFRKDQLAYWENELRIVNYYLRKGTLMDNSDALKYREKVKEHIKKYQPNEDEKFCGFCEEGFAIEDLKEFDGELACSACYYEMLKPL